jgi:chromate transporter
LCSECALSTTLSGITAAVVGVVLNLAVWYALLVLFHTIETHHFQGLVLNAPVLSTLQSTSLVIAIAAMLALMRFKIGMISTLLSSALAGILYYLIVIA